METNVELALLGWALPALGDKSDPTYSAELSNRGSPQRSAPDSQLDLLLLREGYVLLHWGFSGQSLP